MVVKGDAAIPLAFLFIYDSYNTILVAIDCNLLGSARECFEFNHNTDDALR